MTAVLRIDGRRRPRATGIRTRGVALLMVVWLLALLTAVIGAFALAARTESLEGRVLSQGVVADEAARAGLEYAMTRVVELEPTRQWLPDGRDYAWSFNGVDVTVNIVDESGKVDLNGADLDLMANLMMAVGERRDRARRLAAAIVDWRDPDSLSQIEGGAEDPDYESEGLPYGAKDAPFESIAELQQVQGMTPELFAKLEPSLTVYSGQARPNELYAGAPVLKAMGLDPQRVLAERRRPRLPGETPALVGAGTGTYSIESRARLRGGRVSILRAVIRAGNSGVPGSAYTPLRWQAGALARDAGPAADPPNRQTQRPGGASSK